jgi:hypothetical protein
VSTILIGIFVAPLKLASGDVYDFVLAVNSESYLLPNKDVKTITFLTHTESKTQIPERLRKFLNSIKNLGTNLGIYATVPEFCLYGAAKVFYRGIFSGGSGCGTMLLIGGSVIR